MTVVWERYPVARWSPVQRRCGAGPLARAGAGPVGTSDAIRRHCRAATFRYGTRSMPTGAGSGDDVPHARPATAAVGSAREQPPSLCGLKMAGRSPGREEVTRCGSRPPCSAPPPWPR
jgi:hypothetical protein